MKSFLILLLLTIQSLSFGQDSFKLKDVRDDELESLLVARAGLKEIDSDHTEIRIWTGSNLIHLTVNSEQVQKAQLTEFQFAVDRQEIIKRCYYKNVTLSPALAAAIMVKLSEIDSIPSREAIPEWITVLDDSGYGIEVINKGKISEKNYYALFSQTTDRVKRVKDFFEFLDKNIFVLSNLKLPVGEFVDLNRNTVIRVL